MPEEEGCENDLTKVRQSGVQVTMLIVGFRINRYISKICDDVTRMAGPWGKKQLFGVHFYVLSINCLATCDLLAPAQDCFKGGEWACVLSSEKLQKKTKTQMHNMCWSE